VTALQIVLVVLSPLLLLGAIFYFVGSATRRRVEEIRAELSARGDRLLRGPEQGGYSTASARFGKMRSTSVIALSEARFICKRLAMEDFEIPLGEIKGVRLEKTFGGRYVPKSPILVLDLHDKTEVGFQLRDAEAWKAAVQEALQASEPVRG
jgi:hypothetical protein